MPRCTGVCPLIEERRKALQLKTAVETHQALSQALPDVHVGLVHGRLTGPQKAAVMQAFANGEVQLAGCHHRGSRSVLMCRMPV